MPSKSKEQAKIMNAACHNKDFAKKAKLKQKVACDFFKADKRHGKYFKEEIDMVDSISLDIPLFIRILEFAREDAKDDIDLHKIAEKAIELSKLHSLTMDDYNSLISKEEKPEIYERIVKLSKK